MILQPYDVEMGAGTFHPATTLRALGPEALARRLCAAQPPPDRRPLRREPQPAAALLPVPGHHEAEPGRRAGPAAGQLPRHRPRPAAARFPLRRGRLGKPDPRRLGAGLGGLVRRHGGRPVHLFPAGRRHPGRAAQLRDDLRAGTPGDVCAGRRERLRPRLQRRRRELRRRVPARRARIQRATISSTPTPRC